MENKTCCRCNETKPMSDYYAQGGACKACTVKRQKDRHASLTPEQREARRQTQRAYRENNRDRVNERARIQRKKPHTKEWLKQYYEKNREALTKREREYRKLNEEKLREYKRKWQQMNPEKCSQYVERYSSKPEKIELMKARSKRSREELSLGYVGTLLGGQKFAKLPVELLEAKRTQVQILRKIKGVEAKLKERA
jgi:FKBP-type peptidyl-prolyl cis-trans isomerase